MATYFLGQRVRIKWSLGWPELAGQGGRILGPENGLSVHGIWCEWRVAPDCWGTDIAPRPGLGGGERFTPNSDQLAPILPSGHTAGTESFQELMDRLNTQRVEKVEEVGA